MNKCLLSVSFLAPCLWDSCQTQSEKKGWEEGGDDDATSHYFIADDQQCAPWRLPKGIQKYRDIPQFSSFFPSYFISFSVTCLSHSDFMHF